MKKAILAAGLSLLLAVLPACGNSAAAEKSEVAAAASSVDVASEPIDYVYNSHILLPQYADTLTDEQKAVALRLIDAIESGQTTVDATELDKDDASFAAAWYAVRLSAPLSALIDDESFAWKDNAVTFSYTLGTADYAQAVSKWHSLVSDIITKNVKKDNSEAETAFALYQYLAANVKYEYEALSDLDLRARLDVYQALTEGKGVCYHYSLAFAYLAGQCGLKTYEVEADGDPNGHAWNIVELDGVYYHVDATFAGVDYDEKTKKIPDQYFGMSDDARKKTLNGTDVEEKWYIRTAQDDTARTEAPACPNDLKMNG